MFLIKELKAFTFVVHPVFGFFFEEQDNFGRDLIILICEANSVSSCS